VSEYIRITYTRSAIGRSYHQKRIIKALGLHRLHYSRVVLDSPSIRGMIKRVSHLLEVESAVKLDTEKVAETEETASEMELESVAEPITEKAAAEQEEAPEIATETESEKDNDA